MRIAPTLRRLGLESPERSQLALRIQYLFDSGRPERTNHLVFQVGIADEEALRRKRRDIRASAIAGIEAAAAQPAAYEACLGGIAQAGQLQAKAAWPQGLDEVDDVGGAAHRHDDDALGPQVVPLTPCQCIQCRFVAPAFDEYGHAGLQAQGQFARGSRAQGRAWTRDAFRWPAENRPAVFTRRWIAHCVSLPSAYEVSR